MVVHFHRVGADPVRGESGEDLKRRRFDPTEPHGASRPARGKLDRVLRDRVKVLVNVAAVHARALDEAHIAVFKNNEKFSRKSPWGRELGQARQKK
jgi:hypothetical protein